MTVGVQPPTLPDNSSTDRGGLRDATPCRSDNVCIMLQIGLYSSLPYVFLGIFSLLSGLVADFLNAQHLITLTAIRKIFTCSGRFSWMRNIFQVTFS